MLMVNYKYNDFSSSPILYNFFDYDKPFFEKTRFEFIKFYNNMEIRLPKKNFSKQLRYKKLYSINDFRTFSRILSRHGLLIKFKTFVINLILQIREDNSFLNNLVFTSLQYTSHSYWLYYFDKLIELSFLFKITFHRLDKNVRKYNRKRKLKITYKYNYVPFFKRKKYVFSVISKFTRFGLKKNFFDNLYNVVSQITSNDKNNILIKLNYFTHNKIKNFSFQKTLIKSI